MVGILALYPNVKNPYRDLTLLVGDSPVLAHALSGIGALHYALLANGDFSSIPWALNDTGMAGGSLQRQGARLTTNNDSKMEVRPVPKAYEHFLLFKQRALRQLSHDLEDPVMQNDDRTVAAIIALALMDAVESGSGAWKYHLEGAKNLLKRRETESISSSSVVERNNNGKKNSKSRGLVIEGLDQFVIEGCLLFEIMGSTLARPGTLSKPFYTTSSPAALKRLEQTSFVGCPAYLLEAILFVHAQWHSKFEDSSSSSSSVTAPTVDLDSPQSSTASTEGVEPQVRTPSMLLEHIRAFDAAAWAESMQTFHFLPDLSARIALGSAYKSAVYLYASRVLCHQRSSSYQTRSSPSSPSFIPSPPDYDDMAVPSDRRATSYELIRQLCAVPGADPHFKCLLWPTFIAGAESRRRSQRPTIVSLLSGVYYAITSANVRNAAWVLSVMWQKKDLQRQQLSRTRREAWLQQQQAQQPPLAYSSPSSLPSPPLPPPHSSYPHDPRHVGDGIASYGPDVYDDSNGYDDDEDEDDDFDWIQELDNSQIDWLFI